MKKIFAMILALAMVLSMGVASAATCNYTWTSSPAVCRTGVPTIEVVEFVRQSTACGVELVENSCAVALEGERAYYGIKLVVPKDIDRNWWDVAAQAGMKVVYDRLDRPAGTPAPTAIFSLPHWDDVKKGGTFWLAIGEWDATNEQFDAFTNEPTAAATPIEIGDDGAMWTSTFKAADNVFQDKWVNRGCAKVTASIKVDSEGQTVFNALGWQITWATPDTLTFVRGGTAGNDTIELTIDGSEKISLAVVTPKGGTPATMNGYASKATNSYSSPNAGEGPYGQDCAQGKLLYEIFTNFGLDFQNQIVNTDNVLANFGYDATIKDASNFGSQGTAIVDVNCEISIPKTGDVSVIAYAVMALVTAAGAVSLKK